MGKKLSEKQLKLFSDAKRIALIGNGGNLAIAQHMASDIYRHTGKFCFAPDSINLTALGGDNDWKAEWIEYATKGADLIIGITCRVYSPLTSILKKHDNGVDTNVILLCPEKHDSLETVVIDATHYHHFEVKALSTLYEMMEQTGVILPELPKVVQRYDDVTEKRDDIYCIDIDGTLTEPHDGSPVSYTHLTLPTNC